MKKNPILPGLELLYVGGSEVLADRANLSIHIAIIASEWAAIEDVLGILLAEMLSSDPGPTTAAFYAINNLASKCDVLRAVATHQLPDALQKELAEILATTRKRAKERATVVHGQWVVSPKHPKSLLLMPPTQKWRYGARPKPYSKKTFKDIEERIRDLHSVVFEFTTRVAAVRARMTRGHKSQASPPT